MREGISQASRHTLDGTVWVFLCEALALPTGFLVVVLLTRRLGPAGYGLYTLAAVLIAWVEATVGALFHRTTIKLVGEAEDWQPVGVSLTQLHLLTGCVLAGLLIGLATPIATLMGEPIIADYLSLFALDVPIFALVLAHKYILVGLGRFRQRALTSAGRYLARLMLIALLVELGFSVTGAILGNIGATVVELLFCRWYIRPALFRRARLSLRRFLEYSVPLSLFGMSLNILGKMDLLALMALGGTATVAGLYAAAQNLSTVPPGILAVSFAPLLLSTLNRLLKEGQERSAKDMGVQAMRVIVALLPFAAMAAGASKEITLMVYGPAYAHAAPLLAVLSTGAVPLVFISVSAAMLTAGGKPTWALALAGPLVPLAAVGYLGLIPWLGALGAAIGTTLCAILGALAGVVAIHRLWGILPPAGTVLRSLLISGVAFALTACWPTTGILLVVKLLVVVFIIFLSYLLLGETHLGELSWLLGLFRPERPQGGMGTMSIGSSNKRG